MNLLSVDAVRAPRIPFGEMVNNVVEWMIQSWAPVFDGVAGCIGLVVAAFETLLLSPPAGIMIAIFCLIAFLSRGLIAAVLSAAGLLVIYFFDQWDSAMLTVALVLVASLLAITLSVPWGILAAKYRTVSLITKPVMDFMQTLPAFVYLLPAMFFFGLGAAPAVLATIMFAMPPGVRLTELGIRQVDREMVEAGESFGARGGQVLRGIELPLAMPTIMAGVNQVIMLSLSMTVVAGLVGAGGLGGAVVQGLQTLDVALSAESGLAVVILAIYLDRVTATLGNKNAKGSGLALALRALFGLHRRDRKPQEPSTSSQLTTV